MTKSTAEKLRYQKEYNARPENVKRREENNLARQRAIREGKVAKGDGKDLAHKTALDNGGGNSESNVKVQSASKNRGWRKGEAGYRVPNVK